MMRFAFIDNYEHLDSSLEYILENVVYEYDGTEYQVQLTEKMNLFLRNECFCTVECNPPSCQHGSNYIINNSIKMLNKSRPCLDIIYECGTLCTCPSACLNRLVQFGPIDNLKIIYMDKGFKQYGLITLAKISEDCFICEYAGEILTKNEAVRRSSINDATNQMNYIMCLNEISRIDENSVVQTFIDPSRKGNIGRYINHSCEPNCTIISIRTDSFIPKLGIFARRTINANEELTFDYGEGATATVGNTGLEYMDKKLCFCKSKNCRTFLPNNKF